MRIDSQFVPQTLIESSKTVEKKEVKIDNSSERSVEEAQSLAPSLFGSGGIYSPSSLRAAVDYHAKFLTVAQSNVAAADHAATIPRAIIDLLSSR